MTQTLLLSSQIISLFQVLQACDLPAGLVSILTGRRDQLTAALANHSVIKALWYWGSPEVRTQRLYSRAGVPILALDDAWIRSGGPTWNNPVLSASDL